jgi:hypothetical protein
VNKYPHLAADIALVELSCYRWNKQSDWPLLVVPSIVAQTKIIERSIIQVTVKQDGTNEIKVTQEGGPKTESKVTLTEEAFWESLTNRAPNEYAAAKDLIDEYRSRDGVNIEPTVSALVARLSTPNPGQTLSVFFVDYLGHLAVWPHSIKDQLRRVGLDQGLVESYHAVMKKLFKLPAHRKELWRNLSDVDLPAFRVAVDAFIKDVQAAEPEEQ